MIFKGLKKVLCIFMIILCLPMTICNASIDNIVFPESFSQDVFSFNKTTDEEYLELAEFLTGKDMMKYIYGIPFSFESKEDALLYGLGRNEDGSAIRITEKDAINYTIRCAEQDNAIIGQVSLGYPSISTATTYGDGGEILEESEMVDINISYFIGSDFHGHSYAFRAVKAFIDEFYKLNEKSEIHVTFLFECDPENIASFRTIEKLKALQLSETCIDEYKYYKESVSDTMCEVKTEQIRNKTLRNVTTQYFPKSILHKSLIDLEDGECLTIKEYKFYYDKSLEV